MHNDQLLSLHEKSRCFHLRFCSLQLIPWLVGETEAAVFMTSHTALHQTIESVGLKTSWVYS